MLRKLLTVTLLLLCTSFAYAKPIGNAYVLVTNNTNESINIDSTLTLAETHLTRGTDWDGSTITLAPYETKKVLWFSRIVNIKENKRYRFDVTASNPTYPGFNVLMSFNEKGNSVSSTIETDLTLPGEIQKPIFATNGISKLNSHFWDKNYTLYMRAWRPTGHLVHNYHLVINAAETPAFATQNNDQISVLTYNTQLMPFYAGVADNLNQPNIRVNDIPRHLPQYDVIVMEELFDHDLRNTMIKNMSMLYPYHTRVVGDGGKKVLTGGVMIFSKWPIVKENEIVYQASDGADSLASKGAMYAEINKNGKMYHIVGTHLQASTTDADVITRQKQLQELSNFIDTLAIPYEQPLLMAGDFNIDEFGKEKDTLLTSLHADLVNNIGYRYSADGTINTMSVGNGQSRIDYVLYSNVHVKPRVAKNDVFILRAFNDEKMWPKFDLSDHFPTAGYFDFGG